MTEYEVIKAYAEGQTTAVLKSIPHLAISLKKVWYKFNNVQQNGAEEEKKSTLDALFELHKNIQNIALDEIQPIIKDIGIPLIERLAYVEDINVRKLYIGMLILACQKEKHHFVHPRLINIIPNLSGEEINLLADITLSRHKGVILMSYTSDTHGERRGQILEMYNVFPKNLDTIGVQECLHNLCSVGLLIVEKGQTLKGLSQEMDDFKKSVFTKDKKFNLSSPDLTEEEVKYLQEHKVDYPIVTECRLYIHTHLGHMLSELLFIQNRIINP